VANATPEPKVRKQPILNARASGPFGNSPRALRNDDLVPHGLVVVRTLVSKPRFTKYDPKKGTSTFVAPVDQYEHVIAIEDLPASLVPHLPLRPPKSCKACHFTTFRPDSGTGTSWVCARCYPPIEVPA
jgi:hypothetical protein